jgi:hypothetical protein
MRNPTTWLAPALAAVLSMAAWGCGDSSEGGGGFGGSEGPDFSLVLLADTESVLIPTGGDGVAIVAVRVAPGQPKPSVFLHVEDVPEGVTARASESIPADAAQGTVWFEADAKAPPVLLAPVRIVGQSLAGVVREVTVLLTVVPGDPLASPQDMEFGPWAGTAMARVGAGAVLGDLVVLDDGSILAVGFNAERQGWLARWTASGWPHQFYEQQGVLKVQEFWPQRALPLPGGRALLAGRYFPDSFNQPYTYFPALAVLDGADFDWDFGTYGIVQLALGAGDVLSLARFDSVVAASVALREGHSLVRLDLSGRDVYPPALDGPTPVATAFAPDGSVVAVDEFHAFRFEPNGLWNPTFGTNGLLDFGGSLLGAVLPAGDGFLVGGAVAETGTATKAFVSRVTGDGRIDPEFPDHLRWRWDRAGMPKVIDLAALPEGAAALAYEYPKRILDLVRFDWDGRVREQYGDGGIVRVPWLAEYENGALAVDARGNVLVGYIAAPDGVVVNRFLAE